MRQVILAAALAGLAIPVARPAPPTLTAELSRCAALTAADERLACYDALTCATIATADERLACYDALAKGKSAQPPAATAPAPSSDGATGIAGFGAAELKNPSPAKPQGPRQIQAVVAEMSVDRQGTVKLSLDNGQRWTFHDPEPRLKSGDLVTIRRGSLGSFLMTTPSRHTYRVERTL